MLAAQLRIGKVVSSGPNPRYGRYTAIPEPGSTTLYDIASGENIERVIRQRLGLTIHSPVLGSSFQGPAAVRSISDSADAALEVFGLRQPVLVKGERQVAVEPPRSQNALVPPNFEVGGAYRRRDIHVTYGGQRQGGISTPQGRPYLLLFTGTGEHYGYHDGWDKHGIFLYSGEGQIGAMQFTGGNKAIRDHAKNGKDLHLFEQLAKGVVRYVGCFACSSWDYREAKDRHGNARQAIVFYLVPVEAEPAVTLEPAPAAPADQPLDELRNKALAILAGAPQSNPKEAKRLHYERSDAVRAYVLGRAKGVCEACKRSAPFLRLDGSPYLEPHHTRRVSDGGPDHPRWVGAVCPNCHREIHYGANGSERNLQLQARLGVLESGEV